MEPLNTLNAPADGYYEIHSFCKIRPLEIEQTGTIDSAANQQPPQKESRESPSSPLLLSDIGWDRLDALETRTRLSAFEEDWDAPGMGGYDDL